MDLFAILNELEEIVESSPRIPMTKRVIIDEDRLLDYLDRMRTSLPEEVRQAKWIMQEREKVLTDSKKEAERIREDAQKQIIRQAEENEIVHAAKAMADEIVSKAEQIAREIKQGARDYADDILLKLEDELTNTVAEIRDGRAELKGFKNAG